MKITYKITMQEAQLLENFYIAVDAAKVAEANRKAAEEAAN